MFTGIVRAVGQLKCRVDMAQGLRLTFGCGGLATDRWRVGDSIAVAGACLTVVELGADSFAAEVSSETLALTTLGHLVPGAAVNLEPALCAGEPLGGHLVSGHVDGTARVVSVDASGAAQLLQFELPVALMRYVARKGSIAIDGVSLTVNALEGQRIGVTLVPHTLAVTTLGSLQCGQAVNIEVDPIARYLERLLLERHEHD